MIDKIVLVLAILNISHAFPAPQALPVAPPVVGLPAPQFRLEPQALPVAPPVVGLPAPQLPAAPVLNADPQPAAPLFAPKGRAPF